MIVEVFELKHFCYFESLNRNLALTRISAVSLNYVINFFLFASKDIFNFILVYETRRY